MNNNRLLLVGGGAVAAVLILGGALLLMNQAKAPVQAPPATVTSPNPAPVASSPWTPIEPAPEGAMEKEATVVTFDGKGFSPTAVTIKKGEAVKFVNSSSTHMEVASAVHPTHEVYPEFDQGKGTSKDKNEFVFTFTKVGSWKYHNHSPFLTGGIVVVTE